MRQRHKISVCFACLALLLSACHQNLSSQSPVHMEKTKAEMNTKFDFDLPTIPPAKLFQYQVPQNRSLDNGMQVWYVHNPLLPLTTMRVIFNDGAAHDPKDKAGLSAMVSAMLKEGAKGKSPQQISHDIEYIGATIAPDTMQDSTSIYVQTLSQFFPNAIEILHDIWLQPDLKQDALDRLKKIVASRLQQRADSPNDVAKLAGNAAYYGADHPYGRSISGYISTITNLTLDDIKERYRELYHPGHASFIAVGNLPIDEFVKILNDKFGKIERTSPKTYDDLPSLPAPQKRLIVVHKPNAPQTIIRIYQPAVAATSPDSLMWKLVNIPFGDSFTSRLNQNIREDKGFSYGAQSAVVTLKNAGVLLSTSAVAAEVTGDALREFIYELGRLPQGDFKQDEFERGRETWKSSLVQTFETQDGQLATFSNLLIMNRDFDEINRFARSLNDLTLEQFNVAAGAFPTMDEATIVLVGDKDIIAREMKDIDLPEIQYYDTEGNPVNP